jgi:hypothetical protein
VADDAAGVQHHLQDVLVKRIGQLEALDRDPFLPVMDASVCT